MPDYDNTNKGVLFNEEVKKSERSPDWTGKLDVEGKEYRIAAWERTTKTGTPILSLAISEPQERQADNAGATSLKEKWDNVQSSKPKQDVVAEVDDSPISLDDIPF